MKEPWRAILQPVTEPDDTSIWSYTLTPHVWSRSERGRERESDTPVHLTYSMSDQYILGVITDLFISSSFQMGSAEIIKVDFQSDKRLKTCFLTYSPAICIKVWKNVTAWSTSILYNVKRKKKKKPFWPHANCKLPLLSLMTLNTFQFIMKELSFPPLLPLPSKTLSLQVLQ